MTLQQKDIESLQVVHMSVLLELFPDLGPDGGSWQVQGVEGDDLG